MWVLIGAAIVEAGFQAWADTILIAAVVVINVAIGMAQEGKAEKAAEAIKVRVVAAVAQSLRVECVRLCRACTALHTSP
jgi:magnesium-transporting ATPase (P-type)